MSWNPRPLALDDARVCVRCLFFNLSVFGVISGKLKFKIVIFRPFFMSLNSKNVVSHTGIVLYGPGRAEALPILRGVSSRSP